MTFFQNSPECKMEDKKKENKVMEAKKKENKKKENKKMEDQIETLINQLEAQTGGNTIIILILIFYNVSITNGIICDH